VDRRIFRLAFCAAILQVAVVAPTAPETSIVPLFSSFIYHGGALWGDRIRTFLI
jgi:hypothetical protein